MTGVLLVCRGGGGGGEKVCVGESTHDSASSGNGYCGVEAEGVGGDEFWFEIVSCPGSGFGGGGGFGDSEIGEDGVTSCWSSFDLLLWDLRRLVFGTEPPVIAVLPQCSLELRSWRSCPVSSPTVACRW